MDFGRRLCPGSTSRTTTPDEHERASRQFDALIAKVEQTVADEYVEPPAVFDLWMAQTRIELAEHRGEPVSHRWAEVADRWRRMEWPMPAADAEFRSANALLISTGGRSTAGRDLAARLLGAARATATELGAVVLRTDIDDLARRARIDLDDGVADASEATPTEAPDEPPFGLTPREAEVLVLVAEGHSNGQIGARLFVSTKTASVHVSSILRKLGASNRIEAAAIARRHGLFDEEDAGHLNRTFSGTGRRPVHLR